MDISALSEENFNAADWINKNFKKFSEQQKNHDNSKDNEKNHVALAFINSHVSKLQLFVQQVNFAVEESSQQLIEKMPSISKEAITLRNDVQRLKERMCEVRQEVAAVREETGECMEELERLNNLQAKLQVAKESLQESDGWGNLINESEDCFERNDIKGVCEKLIALQKSLQAQEQLPGHQERQAQIEDFKNRLEALASNSLVQCFAENNIVQAQKYVRIFVGIQRLPALQQYYRAVQKNLLQQQWKQSLDMSTQQQQFLTLYYDQLLEHCQRQVKWCGQVFNIDECMVSDGGSDGQLQVLLVIAEILPALEPSRDAHILQLLKMSNDRLELLAQYAQANHTFVMHLNAFIDQSALKVSSELRLQLGNAVFEYFFKFIQQYPRLEETQLSTLIDRLILNQSTLSDAVRHLDDGNTKVFDWIHAACQRCLDITNDLSLCKLIFTLSIVFKRVLENFSKTQRQLSLSIGASVENWSLLQYSMSILQTLADFQAKLNKFEKTLHDRMSTLADRLQSVEKSTTINIFETYDKYERQRILESIADFQKKRSEAINSQYLSLGIFEPIYGILKSHFTESHDLSLNILLQPIESHLANILPPTGSGVNSPVTQIDMPSFSFAPQECITQIGQYLLTLPQHLEPLLLAPSPLLKQALEFCNIKYTQNTPCADILLSLVVEQCCILYQSYILQIKALPPAAAKQIAVDIEYLSSVVEELGLNITLHLSQILTLLKATPESYLAESSGCEPRLVTAIRQMRNIISTQ